MFAFNNALAKLFDLFYLPFKSAHPFWGLLAMSAVTGSSSTFVNARLNWRICNV